MDTDKVTADTATLVAAAIARSDETKTSVARSTLIPRTTLERKLRGGAPFNIHELAEIADFLEIDFADLLPAALKKPAALAA